METARPKGTEGPVRLHVLLGRAGVASRRRAERMIEAGRVAVNGHVVRTLGAKADPAQDVITVDGSLLPPFEPPVYYLLHKPSGYLSSMHDPQDRPTVADLLKPIAQRAYPVGRLDADTEGLLLITNDGAVAQAVLHPRYGVAKTYRVLIEGHPTGEALDRLRMGVLLRDGPTAPAKARVIRRRREDTWIELTLKEGRKRQVKRMCKRVGHPVLKLIRTRIGFLSLEGLGLGELRRLKASEIRRLRSLVKPASG